MATKKAAATKTAAKKKAAASNKKTAATSASASKKKAAAAKKPATPKKSPSKAAAKKPAAVPAAKDKPAKADTTAIKELEKQLDSLEKSLAKAEALAAAATARAVESDDARAQVAKREAAQSRLLQQAQADVRRLEAAVSSATTVKSDSSTLEAELAEANRRMTDLEARTKSAESMRADLQNQLKQSNQAKISAREKQAAAELRAAELSTKLESARADAKPVDDAGSMISTLRRDHDEMRNRALRAEAELAQERKAIKDLTRKSSAKNMLCPRCAEKMQEFRHHGVTLDRCSGCAGLYFDAGELEQVVRAELADGEVLEMVADMPESATRRGGFWGSLFSRWRDDNAVVD